MGTRLFFATWLLLALCSVAFSHPIMMQMVGEPPAAAPSWSCTDADVFCETFDGTSACGDGSHSNCDETYDTASAWASGSLDFNGTGYDSSNGLVMSCTNATNCNVEVQINAGVGAGWSDVYGRFRLKINSEDLANSEDADVLVFWTDGYTHVFTVGITQDGSGNLKAFIADRDHWDVATHTTTLSTDTWYEIEFTYESGAEIAINVDGGTEASDTEGISSGDVERYPFHLYKTETDNEINVTYDDVKIDDDSPPAAY